MTHAVSTLFARVAALAGVILFGATLAAAPASAYDRATEADVVAMMEKAIAHYDAVGREQAMADFNDLDGEFVDGDLYVIICTLDHIYKTHAHNPVLIDNDILVDIQDVNGDFPVRMIVQSAKDNPEGGWVEYTWVNPANDQQEVKKVYVVQHDGDAFAIGYYLAN
ncbi:cache domain-containing protein [uncultured Rhodospira sp.]|uniref:cache domain-containing protein n=1 Tax=uncultured Rhodospira sp. TaxID=1936189 RepID=UPI00261EB156|nr:cache domain-containing protein [uncultured Rhodospira sp.]